MPRDDDDRSKKSWRDIDKQRDKSSHHGQRDGASSPRGGRMERSQAYRSYKSQLNKLFDGGGALPDALKEKLQDTSVGEGAASKKQLMGAIVDAKPGKALAGAVKAYRAEHGFPEDEEVLGKLLDSDDEELVLETIETIARLHDAGMLKRGASLKGRIKTAQMTVDDPDVQRAAKAILAKL